MFWRSSRASTERDATKAAVMGEHTSEVYLLSVLDSDGDLVLVDAPIEALDYPSAWEQATATAFRACHGSGAMPMTITVMKVTQHNKSG